MARRFGRIAVTGSWVAALLATALGTAAPAVAQAGFNFTLPGEMTVYPGATGFSTLPATVSGNADGNLVFAFSSQPLTGQTDQHAGLPTGVSFNPDQRDNCKPVAGFTAVYKCNIVGQNYRPGPSLLIAPDAPDSTTYYGAVYLPRGGDLNAAAQRAQSAGSTPADSTHSTSQFRVVTAEHAARNTLTYDTPDVPAGSPTRQTLHVHAVDQGRLRIYFGKQPGQISWSGHDVDVRVTSVATDDKARCTQRPYTLVDATVLIECDVAPGDTDIAYTLYAAPGTESWKLTALADYNIYSYGSKEITARSDFAIQGPPVRDHARLMARDTSGRLYEYTGTGNGDTPFQPRDQIGTAWNTYTTVTRLAPLQEDKSAGDLVARDGAGVLWYYPSYSHIGGPLGDRIRLGAGWNTYTTLTGTGDLTGDGHPDLLARDHNGVLWLYKGTGNPNAPFTDPTRLGAGWNTFSALTSTTDQTGDSHPDLLARDTHGMLWLYKGTGNPNAPFTDPVRLGAGWNAYTQLLSSPDVNADGNADLLARDANGVLWMYKGTDNPNAPYTDPTRIGGGWNTYTQLI
ncbi:FG-GAP repeat domain-containing protein [Streptomyces violascens]|uniref:FG-GAP repeat domain-containing protein n=1 Tax=Streptomyces violascens TaxID=67381 RepID=UPI0036503390